ncbi:MAG: hypothetical protein JNJ54_20735 [Myxococcaceae bacterium]|nr:hypothetical protein [Myxococcaceae bacterium]
MGVVFLTAVMFTAPASLELEWSVPTGCADVNVARARIGPLSGRASATIVEHATGWQLVVEVANTERRLSTTRCEEAVDAAVLIIKLALEPTTVAPAAPSVPDPAPALVAPTAAPLTFQLGASASIVLGWLPQPLVRFGAAFSARGEHVVVMAELQTGLPQRYPIEGTAGGEAIVHPLADLSAGVCWAVPVGRVRVAPCGRGGFTALSVAGAQLAVSRQAVVLVPHGGPGLRTTVELTSWLEASLTGWARFSSFPVVSLEGSREVLRGNLLSGDLALGIGGVW